jgi:hypothetical protein
MSLMKKMLNERLAFPLPQATTHDGVPLGNGWLGALLYTTDCRTLRVAINRQDYWDHRGGWQLQKDATFENTLRLLTAGDEDGVHKLFAWPERDPQLPEAPGRLPMGRFELVFEETISAAGWVMGDAHAQFDLPGGTVNAIVVRGEPVLAMKLPSSAQVRIEPVPATGDDVETYWKSFGLPSPKVIREGDFCGWVQELPNDPAMCAAAWRCSDEVFIVSVYGDTAEEAIDAAQTLLRRFADERFAAIEAKHDAWWQSYWQQTPIIDTGDAELTLLYLLGMTKFAGMAAPDAPPAGLQGPWVEEFCMPPWNGDYHFNINVQECYWPALASNHAAFIRPMFEMVWSWMPKLQADAKTFLGIDDGILLAHAVDDRATRIYHSYLGIIDYADAGWIAQMMWLYYRYTGDKAFLRDRAYPFIKGCVATYRATMRRDGERFIMPLTMSPEYGWPGKAWGANASFHMALAHALTRAVLEASEILGVDADRRSGWREIEERLPAANVIDGRIAIWDGREHDESHRHHSHIAGVHPFDTLAYEAGGEHAELVRATMERWAMMGMGQWTGWCMPWASMICTRLGWTTMAHTLLTLAKRFFLRRGFGSTHDATSPGLTMYTYRPQIMQLDMAMGCATAVMELCVYTSKGVLTIFGGLPEALADASFSGIVAEGGIRVSATRRCGKTIEVVIEATVDGAIRVRNPFGESSKVRIATANGSATIVSGAVIALTTSAGQTARLAPAQGGFAGIRYSRFCP